MKSISYAITACNEVQELKILINQVKNILTPIDELFVVVDSTNTTKEVYDLLISTRVKFYFEELNNDFSTFKNSLFKYATKNYIFQLDADEQITQKLVEQIQIRLNEKPDIVFLPRENIVNGITHKHLKKWQWNKDQHNRINYPDYQGRVYLNDFEKMLWVGDVHEKLSAKYEEMPLKSLYLPVNQNYDLIHIKTIDRQLFQNNFYNTI